MTEEIKERIALIRRGEVPKGYKKVSIGIIPCDWELKKLSQLMTFRNGINADKNKYGKGVKMISVRDILNSQPIYYNTIIGMVDISPEQVDEFGVTYGDILFQRSSENYEDAGTSNVYLDKNNTATFSGFVIRGKKNEDYNPIYLNALLKTAQARKSIIRRAAGAQHINIGQESLSSVYISYTNKTEQQKIAAILTAQDKLIELKEALLEKKKVQKKYLMQQLLTGKKRLKGFTYHIPKRRLKEFSEYKSSSLTQDALEDNKQSVEFKYPVYNATGIFTYADFYENSFEYIAIIKDGAGIGRTQFCCCKSSIIGTLGCICGKENVNIKFLYYLLCQIDYKKYAKGSTIPHLYYKDYSMEKVIYPNLKEQTAIAEVLTTADRELTLLQQDIDMEKQKKKALMQLLLTGIVRVQA